MPVTPDAGEDFPPEENEETAHLSDCVREAPIAALLTAFIAGLFIGRLVL
jgi:hypothetical protein